MTPDSPTPREAIESSLTALLLGELSPDHAAALRELMAHDPELARLHDRLKHAIELVGQAETAPAEPVAAHPEPLKLSDRRRQQLFQLFKTVKPKEFAKPRRRELSPVLAVAAGLAAVALISAMLLPALTKAGSHATRRLNSVGDSEFYESLGRSMGPSGLAAGSRPPGGNREIPSAQSERGTFAVPVEAPAPAPAAPVPQSFLSASESPPPVTIVLPPPGEASMPPTTLAGITTGEARPSPGAPVKGLFDDSGLPSDAGAWRESGGAKLALPAAVPSQPAGVVLADGDTQGRIDRSRFNKALNNSSEADIPASRSALPPPEFIGRPLPTATGGAPARRSGGNKALAAGGMMGGGTGGGLNWGEPQNPPSLAYNTWAALPEPNIGLPMAGPPASNQSRESESVRGPAGQLAFGKAAGNVYNLGVFGYVEAAKDNFSLRTEQAPKSTDTALAEKGKVPVLGDVSGTGSLFQSQTANAFMPPGPAEKAAENEAVTRQLYRIASDQEPAKARSFRERQIGRDEVTFSVDSVTPAQQAGASDIGREKGLTNGGAGSEGRMLFANPLPKPKQDSQQTPLHADAKREVEDARRSGQRGAKEKVEDLRAQLDASDEAKKPAIPTPPPIPQPETQTRENAFSTFSLNVSDVSFKLAAASLEKGALPEPASIRSEEFINAFDYRDPEPAPGAPLAFAWERSSYPFAQNRDLLRFSLKTAAQGRQPGRPLNLVLLLDNSGSMERADRVRIIHAALRVLAAQLQPQDKFSVVTFARTARLWVDGVPGNQAGKVADDLDSLVPQGGTNLEDALKLAYQTALRHYLANGINRVVLLTDGAANLGNVEPDALKKKVEDHRKQGIALDGFGIGWEGYNDDLLEVLTRNGDGRYGFVNTPEEAATEFAGQLAGALRIAASDVKVQVEFNPDRVTAYRQIGYAKHQLTKEQFRDNTVDAAEIGAAEAGNALYVVEVNPRGEGPLATVRARYKIPGTADYREQAWPVPYTGSVELLERSTPAQRLAAAGGAFSEWLASSPYAAEVTPDRLLGCLTGVPETYGAEARPKKLEWMIRQAKSLAGK